MPTAISQRDRIASTLAVEELRPCPDAWDLAQWLSSLPNLLYLDSAALHANLGRYSFVSADPVEWIWSRGTTIWSRSSGKLRDTDPFRVLAGRLAAFRAESHEDVPPFQGGVAGL